MSSLKMSDAWQIDFWDVGQGDGAVILLPTGEYILIDSGPASFANPLPSWFLQPRYHDAKARIKAVVVTHNDQDHIGGLLKLLNDPRQQIDAVYLVVDKTAAQLPKDMKATWVALSKRKQEGKTQTLLLNTQNPTLYKDASFCLTVRHPQPLDAFGSRPNNSVSGILVLERASDGVPFVIWCGDAMLATVAKHCTATSPAVMVGPHHGAPQDKGKHAFRDGLNTIHPNCIFVSHGNQHKHPDHDYIYAAAHLPATVCCSELAASCPAAALTTEQHLFPGSARLNLPSPLNARQCRGTMRVFVRGDGVCHDNPNHEEFMNRIKQRSTYFCR